MFLLIHFNGIVGYCKNYYVVDSEDGYTEINSDSKRVITTNQGWLEQWYYLIGATECDEGMKLRRNGNIKPAFGWWVQKVLKKWDRIVMKSKTHRKVKKQMKLSVEIPETIEEAQLCGRMP